MSAVPVSRPALQLVRMQRAQIPAVLAIENSLYPFPWTAGNFADSLSSAYEAWVLLDADEVAGYFLLMQVVDEAHLLNITVREDLQGGGLGRAMLDHAVSVAAALGTGSMLLEVRPSNVRAKAIYERYGFVSIGRRMGYYPTAAEPREDALMMRLAL